MPKHTLSGLTAIAAAVIAISGGCSSTSSTATGGAVTDLGAGDPGPRGIRFAASGEVLALTGYAFPPAQADDVAFVDGWEVKFTRLLTTIDAVTLSDNADRSPGDPSQTGAPLFQLRGPWAVDLARPDPRNLPGKGGPGEQAVPFASVVSDRLSTDGTRYAFGFDLVAATAAAKNVNLDAAASADYQSMVADGCAVLYVGTAKFKGNKADPQCYPSDRRAFPDVVDFRFCFKSPTTYLNCQNPDNDPARPFDGEEHERGIAIVDGASVIAQVTVHTDHPFWDSVLHDSPPHFDQFAARVVGQPGPPATVTLEMTKGVDYTAYTDSTGAALQWRYCIDPAADVHPKLTGPMSFDAQSVPHATGADASSGLRDYYDFATYDQSTQGHLNSDGLCYVKRNYPSPL
jgi:hypothetical protein